MSVPEARRLPGFHGVWLAFRALPGSGESNEVDTGLLTGAERTLFESFTTPKRQAEWWAGRMAARGALRAIGAGAASILRAPNGAPRLEGPHAANAAVAITHGRRWAGAVASRSDGPTPHVGLDLVDAEDGPRIVRIANRHFRAGELTMMTTDARAGLLAWAAREAAAKATRTGMFAYGLSEVWITRIDGPEGTLTLNADGLSGAYARAPDGGWIVFVRASPDAVAHAQAIAQRRHAPPDA